MVVWNKADHVARVTCRKCNTEHQIEVTKSHYRDWKNGELIQSAMPYLTADQRELLISGICGPCYDGLFEQPAPKKKRTTKKGGETNGTGEAQ